MTAIGKVRRRLARARLRRWFGVHFGLAVALFFVGVLAGYGFSDPEIVQEMTPYGAGGTLPVEFTAGTIFLNNLLAVGVDALGLVTLGLASAFSLLLNGFVLGLVMGLASTEVSPLLALALVVPHGVLELPAFWLVAAVAFRVTHRLARYLWGRDERVLTRQELFEVGVLFVATVVLIGVAAWIEVNVTPVVGDLVAG
jgi:stage II sporulation protein M